MAVARIEPDFVVTPKVRERRNDRPAMLVDDNGVRVPNGRRSRYSLAGSDYPAPKPFLAAPRSRRAESGKLVTTFLVLGSITATAPAPVSSPSPLTAGTFDIEFAGPRTPLALFGAIGGFRCVHSCRQIRTSPDDCVGVVEMRLTKGGSSALFAIMTR